MSSTANSAQPNILCSYCQESNPYDAKFCIVCGKPLDPGVTGPTILLSHIPCDADDNQAKTPSAGRQILDWCQRRKFSIAVVAIAILLIQRLVAPSPRSSLIRSTSQQAATLGYSPVPIVVATAHVLIQTASPAPTAPVTLGLLPAYYTPGPIEQSAATYNFSILVEGFFQAVEVKDQAIIRSFLAHSLSDEQREQMVSDRFREYLIGRDNLFLNLFATNQSGGYSHSQGYVQYEDNTYRGVQVWMVYEDHTWRISSVKLSRRTYSRVPRYDPVDYQ